jgi:hypothetical protein
MEVKLFYLRDHSLIIQIPIYMIFKKSKFFSNLKVGGFFHISFCLSLVEIFIYKKIASCISLFTKYLKMIIG